MSRKLAVRRTSLLLLATIGCAGTQAEPAVSEPVDPDDVPITIDDVDMPVSYRGAVERVRAYRNRIRDAVAAKTPSSPSKTPFNGSLV